MKQQLQVKLIVYHPFAGSSQRYCLSIGLFIENSIS